MLLISDLELNLMTLLGEGGAGGLTYTIDISQLQKGTYFVKIDNESKQFVKE